MTCTRLTARLALPLAAVLACSASGRTRPVQAVAAATTVAPARPDRCTAVPAGEALQAWIDRAPAATALCLSEGSFSGPLRITRPIVVWGTRRSIVRTKGTGTTIEVKGPGSALLGFTVDGSGSRYDQQDAAIAVRADDVRVEGVRVVRAMFGILADRAHRVVLRANVVEGDPRQARGLRGDGIRLWETRSSLIADNVLTDSRDLVVWYSPANRILHNRVERGRYGTHLMYSHDNVVEGNEYRGNAVGVFVMYSHDVEVRGNRFLDASGAGGMGVGLKDSGDVTVEDNLFVHDAAGLYVDNSPSSRDDENVIAGNTFRLCDVAVAFHGDTAGNVLRGNSLASNREQVSVDGGGNAQGARWEGNHFDDYVGYDLDGDGTGDVPYELRRLSTHLSSGVPSLAFFTGTPAFGVIDVLGRVVPLFTPHTLLVDRRPRMEDPGHED